MCVGFVVFLFGFVGLGVVVWGCGFVLWGLVFRFLLLWGFFYLCLRGCVVFVFRVGVYCFGLFLIRFCWVFDLVRFLYSLGSSFVFCVGGRVVVACGFWFLLVTVVVLFFCFAIGFDSCVVLWC